MEKSDAAGMRLGRALESREKPRGVAQASRRSPPHTFRYPPTATPDATLTKPNKSIQMTPLALPYSVAVGDSTRRTYQNALERLSHPHKLSLNINIAERSNVSSQIPRKRAFCLTLHAAGNACRVSSQGCTDDSRPGHSLLRFPPTSTPSCASADPPRSACPSPTLACPPSTAPSCVQQPAQNARSSGPFGSTPSPTIFRI